MVAIFVCVGCLEGPDCVAEPVVEREVFGQSAEKGLN